MNFIYPFQPPAILNKEIDTLLIDKINKQCDELLPNKQELEATSQLLNTFPHGDAVNIYYPIEELQKEIIEASYYYIGSFENTTNATIIPDGNRLNIAKMWFLDLYDKDYLNAHHHGGNLLSGIIYLKIPNVPKTSYPNGCIEFTYNPMVLPEKLINSNTFMLEPKEKQMYIWPSWLFHTVYPYYGNESRRSLSFNINIAPV